MIKQKESQFLAEVEADMREIEFHIAELARLMGWSAPEPSAEIEESLEDNSEWSQPEWWDVYVVDYVEMTCEVVYCKVAIEDAEEFKAFRKDTKSQVVILPSGFEIVNREEQARKLGEVASQLLDLAFGHSADDEATNINATFHEAVINGRVEQECC